MSSKTFDGFAPLQKPKSAITFKGLNLSGKRNIESFKGLLMLRSVPSLFSPKENVEQEGVWLSFAKNPKRRMRMMHYYWSHFWSTLIICKNEKASKKGTIISRRDWVHCFGSVFTKSIAMCSSCWTLALRGTEFQQPTGGESVKDSILLVLPFNPIIITLQNITPLSRPLYIEV